MFTILFGKLVYYFPLSMAEDGVYLPCNPTLTFDLTSDFVKSGPIWDNNPELLAILALFVVS